MIIYSKKDLEQGALKCHLKNSGIQYDNRLFSYVEENSATDVIYNKVRYQITTPASESNVVGRIINGGQEKAGIGNIEGSHFHVSSNSSVPMFTATYNPLESWQEFVVKPITRKITTEGKGVTLLIYSPLMVPPFISSGDYRKLSYDIPKSSFDHIILVDSFRNINLK